MRVYLAAPFAMQPQMRLVREALNKHGITVTSRWLDVSADGHNVLTIEERRDWAMKDLADVDAADYLVAYNPTSWHNRGQGGRHVELGYAIARGKCIIYVGEERENLFHWHPAIKAHIEPSYVGESTPILVDVLVKLHANWFLPVSER